MLLGSCFSRNLGFPRGSAVKNLPAVQKTQVWSLGQEDPLEKGMATHSSILAWRIPWTEEPGGLQSLGSQRVGHDWSDWARTQVALFERTRLPMQETQEMQVRSLGQEDTLEEAMATHSSILAWRIPWTWEPSGLQSTGLPKGRHEWSNLALMHTCSKNLAAMPRPPLSRLPGHRLRHWGVRGNRKHVGFFPGLYLFLFFSGWKLHGGLLKESAHFHRSHKSFPLSGKAAQALRGPPPLVVTHSEGQR